MFDIGMFEMLLLLVIGLIILGPERLPEATRMIGAWFSKAKRTIIDVRTNIEHEVKAHELRERIKQELEKSGLHDIHEELTKQETLLREQLLHGERPTLKKPQRHTEPPNYPDIPDGHDPIASAPVSSDELLGNTANTQANETPIPGVTLTKSVTSGPSPHKPEDTTPPATPEKDEHGQTGTNAP